MIVPTVKTCQNDRACSKEKTFDSLYLAFETKTRMMDISRQQDKLGSSTIIQYLRVNNI